MRFIWIALVAILELTAALPVNNLDEDALIHLLSKTDARGRNSALENILMGVMEDLRALMQTGSEAVPVLDPFYLDRLYVDDETIPLPGARLEINDLTASKLSTFELNNVSVSSASSSIFVQQYNVLVDGEVPAIEVDVGKYDLFMSLDGMSIFGNGDAKIVIVKPRLKVDLLVRAQVRLGGIFLNLLTTRIEFSLADLQPALNGMFENPAVDGFVNLFIRNLVLELLEAYSEVLTDTVSPIVQNLANEFLADFNLISILG